MEPNRCDDFVSDTLKRESAKVTRLIELLNQDWSGRPIDRIERYDDISIAGTRFHGWAVWFDASPDE